MSILNVDEINSVNPLLPVTIHGASVPLFGTVPLMTVNPPKPDGTAQTAVKLTAGTGAPNNADGSNGDFYFRSDGGASTTIYQKRTGAWVGIV